MAHLGSLVESLPAGLLHQVGNQTNTHTDKPTQRQHGQTNTKTRTDKPTQRHAHTARHTKNKNHTGGGGRREPECWTASTCLSHQVLFFVSPGAIFCLTWCYFLSHQVLFFVLQGAIFFSPGALGIPNIPYSDLQKKPLPCERTSRIFPPGPS